jgi:hypothetical protein
MGILTLPPEIKSIHGHIGSYVFYNAYGIQYVRSYTVPRNPRTELQQKTRNGLAGAVKLWQQLSEEEKSRYNRLAEGTALSGYNIFISMTLKSGKTVSEYAALSRLVRRSSIHDSYMICPSSVPVRQKLNPACNRHFSNVIALKKPPGELLKAS